MQKQILIFTVLCALLFSSCEKTIDFNGEEMAPKIVVNGLLVAGKPADVSVTKTQSYLSDSYSFEILSDAKVDLYVDGEFAETLAFIEVDDAELEVYGSYYSYDSYYRKWIFRSETVVENGRTYKLEVANEGLNPVTCETTVPAPVELIELDTATEYISLEYGKQKLLGVNVTFADNIQNRDYYRIQVNQVNGVNKNYYSGAEMNSDTVLLSKQSSLNVNLFDPVFGSSTDEADEIISGTPDNKYALFDDDDINGKEYTLKIRLPETYIPFSIDDSTGNFIEKQVVLYALSPEYYEYLKSATNHFYYADDYFSEPVPVYTNVKGGMGIFAAIDSASYSIVSGIYPMEGKVYVDNYNNGGYGYGYGSY